MASLFASVPSAPPTVEAGDEEADTSEGVAPQVRLPLRVRTQFAAGVQTVGDAFQVCSILFAEQLERAMIEKPVPNQPIPGDSSARSAFRLLLTDAQQRDLFMKTANSSANWSRLRPLVGAPPYHFLKPQDASALNATGFARGRANMTYNEYNRVANVHQFGTGQLVDEHTREYRVAPRSFSDEDPLPGGEYLRSAKDLVLHVKIKPRGIQKKKQLFNSEFKKQLFFPQVGEQIALRESNALMSVRGLHQPSETVVKVKALWLRGVGASTAAVLIGL